jgi:hypothetical protein
MHMMMFFLPFLMVRSIASPKKIKFSNSKSASFSFQFCDKKLRLENLPPKNRKLTQIYTRKNKPSKNFGLKNDKKNLRKKKKRKEKALQKVQLSFSHPK